MITVRALLAEASGVLATESAPREAEIVLAHALDRTRAWLFAHSDDVVVGHTADRFRALVARRCAGEPVAYLTGHREFWSLDLSVTPDVLIPRPETELLVELALRHIPQSEKVDILDLGTGSGAIALAIGSERPQARIVAVDSSEAALGVARANASRLEIGNVEFRRGDWFRELHDARFEVILSNPPYVASGDEHLRRGDLRFEPALALAAGIDGLEAIRKIVAQSPDHLHDGGVLLIEHGFDQGSALRTLLAQCEFVDVFTAKDVEARERVSGGTIRAC